MSNENEEINPLILTGIEELAKEVALVELPIYNKYLQGRIDYWKSKGEVEHWIKIGLLKEELAISEEILAFLNK
jgi:hypothetical protein